MKWMLAITLLLAGCSAPAPGAPAALTPGYEAFWDAWGRAERAGDPALVDALDPLLTSLRQAVTERVATGVAVQGEVRRRGMAQEEAIGGGYRVTACVDYDGRREMKDGAAIDPPDKADQRVAVVMRESDGVWRGVNLYYEGDC